MSETAPYTQTISIENLIFDPKNPRLPSSVNASDEQSVIAWMLDDAGIIELMLSIGEQGYFGGDPLLVVPADRSGDFIVVEGNRRLAALKLLQNPNLTTVKRKSVANVVEQVEKRPSHVPAIVYPSRDSILDYLGFRHITGIKEWSPLAKARYLEELLNKRLAVGVSEDEVYKQLAKTIGSRVDYVKRMLLGLDLYEEIERNDFYNIKNLDEENISFSLVTTSLANNNIVSFLGLENAQDLEHENLNYDHLEELTTWIFSKDTTGKTKLGESRNFRYLNKVVDSAAALSVFRAGYSLQEAVAFTDEPLTHFRELAQETRSKLVELQDQLHLIKGGFGDTDLEILGRISNLVADIRAVVKNRISQDES